ncbi:hypothetical protein BT63DRAFT_423673 [Microthyrium microscopicum]|uniref:Uncharacterized protein n=1 Tax=Microthyrium microscopicum TaxID=703497 RepID=A0A6A6UIU3_9PEZI|nr:hypothetical protein BT63DRAFT_423673 [Microthyrium microscopicum]
MRDDDGLLTELYNALEGQPSSIFLHELILEGWVEAGDQDMARETAMMSMSLDPNNAIGNRYLKRRGAAGSRRQPKMASPPPQKTTSKSHQVPRSAAILETEEQRNEAERTLEAGYKELMLVARILKEEVRGLSEMEHTTSEHLDGQSSGSPFDNPGLGDMLSVMEAISGGDISVAVPMPQPLSVQELARAIKKSPGQIEELIAEDFENVNGWASSQNEGITTDEKRQRVLKRMHLLEAALPESMEKEIAAAFAHFERDQLNKRYANDETMYGDRVEDIPRGRFMVTEDNYAWDMEELSKALEVNSGVMRNPLSKQLFSQADIKKILAHPLGRQLRQLQLSQSKLKKGVRPATIEKIQKLGQVMLADQSEDAGPSREAMDEFLGFVVTLPDSEQKTINSLKIAATDRHTGQPYDYTIGESVKDAKANTTCFHKVGDYLTQAAKYLRKG